MFVACGIWCLADVLSVSPSLEQTVKSGPTSCVRPNQLSQANANQLNQAQPVKSWAQPVKSGPTS